jgi:FAD/FMN-containing dehydrogenase
MSGGAVTESVLVDFRKYFTAIENVTESTAQVQPGVLYKDFEIETLKRRALMPTYPASRDLASVGGLVNNNSGGEKSLEYGKTQNFVNELRVVFSDGVARTVKPLTKAELDVKMNQQDFEGGLYRQLFILLDGNYDKIKGAKPRVSKNSAGYYLWDVWNRETGTFDLTQLICGAQGTLGWKGVVKLFLSFVPTGLHFWRGFPKLVLMVEFNGETEDEVRQKVKTLHKDLSKFRARYEINGFEEDPTEGKSQKFWIMRRYSFQLLRSKVKDKHTAPFIDDFIVNPQYLTEFFPKLRKIIKKYNLFATIAGHMGDGNFHIIPLMKIEDPKERAKLEPAMREVNNLVLEYHGSLTAEHNDGMIRGPWLEAQYGKEITDMFRQTKKIMDPENIFNPHKKTDATWEYSMSHIREHF